MELGPIEAEKLYIQGAHCYTKEEYPSLEADSGDESRGQAFGQTLLVVMHHLVRGSI